VAQAKILGRWWRFLALSIITWGLFPRILLLFLAKRDFHLTVEKMLLSHPSSHILLKRMNEVHITTHGTEENTYSEGNRYSTQTEHLDIILAHTLIGWNMDHTLLADIIEVKQIAADHIFSAGGKNTLQEDDDIISKVDTSAIIMVKAWEPPMREFLDFAASLYSHSAKKVTVFPVGTPEKGFMPEKSDVNIWNDKIASLRRPHIGIYRDSL